MHERLVKDVRLGIPNKHDFWVVLDCKAPMLPPACSINIFKHVQSLVGNLGQVFNTNGFRSSMVYIKYTSIHMFKFQSSLGKFGEVWSSLVKFGPVWSSLEIRFIYSNFSQYWSSRFEFGQFWRAPHVPV